MTNKPFRITHDTLNPKEIRLDVDRIDEQIKKLDVASVTQRMDEVDAQLAQKPSYDEARLKSVKLEPEDLSEETLGLVTGTGSVNLLSIPQNRSVSYEKTDFLKTGKNLFDKSKRAIGYLITYSNGSLTALSSYDTSDFIPVAAGQSYTINKVRQFCLFDSEKKYLSGVNNSAYGSYTFTPAQDGYLRFSTGVTFIDTAQVEKGSQVTPYEAFGYVVSELLFTEEQKTKIKDIVTPTVSKIKGVKVVKNGESFNLSSQFNSDKQITIRTVRNGSLNGSFNFVETLVGSDSIHTIGDDITPIRTFTTVGANHGYTNIQEITMSSHGKTAADLGSIWTDGVTNYTLLKISGNVLTFGCPYTVTDGVTSSLKVDPIANLSHVSGATNTSVIDITTRSATPQLYPSINNISVKYILDGEEITEDGEYFGTELQVQEQYDVMDYKAIIDYAQSNIGQSYVNGNIEGLVQLSNTFTYGEGLKCTTSHSMKVLKKAKFGRCGFLQSVALNAISGHTRKRFMPNVNVKNGFDFANGIDLDAYNTTLFFRPVDCVDPTIPPNHHVDWIYFNGVKKYGFTMGYIVDKTNSKNANRVNSPYVWDMRNTKKSYPIVIEDTTLEAGAYMNFMGFRNYLSPEEVGEATCINSVKDRKDVYMYVDFNKQVTAFNQQMRNEIGKSISFLQGENYTQLNDVVDSAGVVFSVNSTLGNSVLKIN
jgi:hypothetical protein